MADARIVVRIQGEDAGGRRIKRTLDDVARSGDRATNANKRLSSQLRKTSRSADLLKRAFTGVIIALGIRKLIRVSDQFVVLETNLKNVTATTEEFNSVFDDLFVIAQKNGDTFFGLTETYKKLNISLSDSVKNSVDLVKVTELLSRGFAASGTSATTAAGASLQLTQGLATNFKAAGQELNSIIEGAPLLAKLIAEQLGGESAADLKIFAEAGKITAQNFLEALIAAEAGIKAFEIPPTIGRSVQRVSNAFLKLTGQSETVKKTAASIANALDSLSENLDRVAKAIVVLAQVALSALIGKLASLAIAFTLNLRLQRLNAVAALNLAKANLAAGGSFAAVATAQTAVAASSITLTRVLVALGVAGRGVLGILGGWPGVIIAAGIAIFTFKDQIKTGLISALEDALDILDKVLKKLKELSNFATSGLGALFATGAAKLGFIDENALAEVLANEVAGNRTSIRQPITPPRPVRRPGAAAAARGPTLPVEGAKQAQKELKKLIRDTRTEQERLINSINKLTDLRAFAGTASEVEAIDRALEIANEQLKTASDVLPGLEDGMKAVREQTDKFAGSVADAFGDFITGARSAKDILRSLVSDLISLSVKQSITGPLSGLLSSALGGVVGGIFGGGGAVTPPLPVRRPAFAHGGSMTLGGVGGIDQNVLSLNGRPIADVTRGENLTVTPQGGRSGGGGITINQTINVSTGVQETVQAELINFLPEVEKSTLAAIEDANARGF